MGMLGPDDPLPVEARRVVVAGISGAGKTTLAGRIGGVLGLPHTEIDGLFHGPNWVPRESFLTDVLNLVSGNEWITEWQYSRARDLLAGRADLMVWLDLPRRTVMRRVIRRTVARRVRRTQLWNGNVEPPLHAFFTEREHIVRWAWTQYHRSREKVLTLHRQRPDLPIVQLGSPTEVDRWLSALTPPGAAPPARAGR